MKMETIEDTREKLDIFIRTIVREEIARYMHLNGKEMLLELKYLHIGRDEEKEEIKSLIRKENSDCCDSKIEEECSDEGENAVITTLASNLSEIFQGREVESEEMFIKKILEFINSIKSENRAIVKKYEEKEKEIRTLSLKIENLSKDYKEKEEKLTHKLETAIYEKQAEVSKLNTYIEELKVKEEQAERLYRTKLAEMEKNLEMERRTAEEHLGIVKRELTKIERELKTAEDELIELNNKKRDLENQITKKTSEYNKLKSESADFEKQAKETMKFLTENINKQKEIIKENEIEKAKLQDLYNIADLYEKYLGISQTTKDKLANLVRSENIGNFAVCCYHLDTMDDIWEFVNAEVRNGTLKDTDCKVLAEIFTYFVEQKNKMYKEALYRVAVPEKGEYFDATKHLDADRNGADKIKEVIFPGYGVLEDRKDPTQRDDERKYKRMKKLPIVKTM